MATPPPLSSAARTVWDPVGYPSPPSLKCAREIAGGVPPLPETKHLQPLQRGCQDIPRSK